MRPEEIGLGVEYETVEEAARDFLVVQLARWLEPHRLECFGCFSGRPCDKFAANVLAIMAALPEPEDAEAPVVRGAAAARAASDAVWGGWH